MLTDIWNFRCLPTMCPSRGFYYNNPYFFLHSEPCCQQNNFLDTCCFPGMSCVTECSLQCESELCPQVCALTIPCTHSITNKSNPKSFNKVFNYRNLKNASTGAKY
eukprot:NODE_6250_length_907_cov_29.852041_g5658_i0.p1 GENE.NODE_6250_length_907_cov_29.852041_g5658_i0~~NODE_6250_length_907_cov_29.852041_g5658_i0.p1  ORF type:complete len:106 (+),score=3.79 NODE_6250_length_907_cov_29.852041_g5658_i0:510-827(+)